MTSKKLKDGVFWLSLGNITSRILGIIYLIPWLAMMGGALHQETAQALFNTAYTPYALLISLGTAGFPSAIARKVAFYSGKGDEDSAELFGRIGFISMLASGFICGGTLYALAPFIAQNSPVSDINSGIVALRCLIPAILILPSMSALRGWFQGRSDLQAFGVSQIWEQFIRILTMLVGTFTVTIVLNENFKIAVYISISAAFVGALASYAYLIRRMLAFRNKQRTCVKTSSKEILLNLFLISKESLPFILIGSGISVAQLVDQLFFKQIMISQNKVPAGVTQYIYTIFSANPAKLTTVLIAIALSASESVLPLISAKMSTPVKNFNAISADITANLKIVLAVLLPICMIVAACALPIYTIFFGYNIQAAGYLVLNIIQCFVVAVTFNLLTVLQALRMSKKAAFLLIIGLIVKISLQYPLVELFGGPGAIWGTTIAFGIVGILSYSVLSAYYPINVRDFSAFPSALLIFGLTVLLIRVVTQLFNLDSHFHNKIICCAYVGFAFVLEISALVKIYNQTGLSRDVFGAEVNLSKIVTLGNKQ